MTKEVTRELFDKYVPSGDYFAQSREDFCETGRRMMELEEQVYLSVTSTVSGPSRPARSVQEYHLSLDEPAFQGTFQSFGRNAQGNSVVVRRMPEVLDTRESPDKELLEAIVGTEKAAGLYWETAHQTFHPGGNHTQARIYHLKGEMH